MQVTQHNLVGPLRRSFHRSERESNIFSFEIHLPSLEMIEFKHNTLIRMMTCSQNTCRENEREREKHNHENGRKVKRKESEQDWKGKQFHSFVSHLTSVLLIFSWSQTSWNNCHWKLKCALVLSLSLTYDILPFISFRTAVFAAHTENSRNYNSSITFPARHVMQQIMGLVSNKNTSTLLN
jgi:hypothetical protein